jgi:hypothetical protein
MQFRGLRWLVRRVACAVTDHRWVKLPPTVDQREHWRLAYATAWPVFVSVSELGEGVMTATRDRFCRRCARHEQLLEREIENLWEHGRRLAGEPS